MDDKVIQEIFDYKIPIIKTKLNVNYSLLYWRIRKIVYDMPLKLMNSARAEKHLVFSSSLLCTCFLFPDTATAQRLLTLTHLMALYFSVDDFIGYEKSDKGYNNLCALITDSSTKIAKSPTEKLLKSILENIKNSYSTEQFEFFAKRLGEYVQSNQKETSSLTDEQLNKQFNSVEEILDSRFDTNGAHPLYALIDYAMQINVNKYFTDERINAFVRLMNTHGSYVNDIVSLKKECRENQLKFNTIYYFYRKGNSIAESVEILRQKIDKIEDQMLALKYELALENRSDPDFIKYLNAIESIASGNLFWSLFAPRYNVYNKIAISDIFYDCDHFAELHDEFDANTFEHIWNYTY